MALSCSSVNGVTLMWYRMSGRAFRSIVWSFCVSSSGVAASFLLISLSLTFSWLNSSFHVRSAVVHIPRYLYGSCGCRIGTVSPVGPNVMLSMLVGSVLSLLVLSLFISVAVMALLGTFTSR